MTLVFVAPDNPQYLAQWESWSPGGSSTFMRIFSNVNANVPMAALNPSNPAFTDEEAATIREMLYGQIFDAYGEPIDLLVRDRGGRYRSRNSRNYTLYTAEGYEIGTINLVRDIDSEAFNTPPFPSLFPPDRAEITTREEFEARVGFQYAQAQAEEILGRAIRVPVVPGFSEPQFRIGNNLPSVTIAIYREITPWSIPLQVRVTLPRGEDQEPFERLAVGAVTLFYINDTRVYRAAQQSGHVCPHVSYHWAYGGLVYEFAVPRRVYLTNDEIHTLIRSMIDTEINF
jgi:hypothetical protein